MLGLLGSRSLCWQPALGSTYVRPTELLDLPIASLVQICNNVGVRDLARLESSCKLLRYAVNQCLAEYKVLSLQDQPAVLVQPFLMWGAAPGKLDSLACLRISGNACKALLDICVKSLQGGFSLWPRLQHLHLTYGRALKDGHIYLITQTWPQLLSLNLAGCVNLTDAALHFAADQLVHLQLVDCSNWMYCTDAGVDYLARKQPTLQHVALDGCTRITSSAVASLALHCPGLQTLSACNCFRICDVALASLTAHPTVATLKFQQCPKLSSIRSLAACPSLTTLDVTGCPFVTDAELHALLHAAGGTIKHLVLSGCVGISGASLRTIGLLCPAIVSLNLSRLELADDHLLYLAAGCGTLEHLVVDWCSSLSDQSLVPVVKACPALVSLSMEGVYNATDVLLCALAAHCPGLQVLNIRTCLQLTARYIVHLSARVQLKVLQLGGIISDHSMAFLAAELARHCPGCQVCF